MPRPVPAAPDLPDRAISYLAERIAWLEVLLHGLVLRRRGESGAAESAVRAATLLQRLRRREAGEADLPIHRLRRRHPLGTFDEQALWLAVAAQLDDHIQELLASAAEDARRGYPSPWAALELFCEGRRDRLRALRAFRPGAPLADRALLALHPRDVAPDNLLLHELRPAPYVVGFLQCDAGISPRLAELARRTAPAIGIEDLALAPEDAAAFAHLLPPLRAVGTDAGARWTANDSYDVQAAVAVLLTSAPGNGRTLVARALAGEAGAGLVEVDAARLAGLPAADAARAVDALFREVGFSGDWLLFDAAEALLKESAPEISLTDRTALVAAVRDGIQRTDTVVILTATSGDEVARPVRDRVLVHHELRPLPREACELAWQLNVPATVVLARDVDVRQLAETYSLSGRRIQNALHLAVLAQEGAELTQERLAEAAARQQAPGLGSFARRTWVSRRRDDLLVPPDLQRQVDEIIATERHREQVLREWGLAGRFQKGLGVICLFDGEPGTGKTLAAEVIASELNMPLYTISVSNIVSKWIGETEKNLQRIFDDAQKNRCVMLFDEADTLFSKRTEVHRAVDRYSNMEVGLLLQLVEAYRGLVLLTTNLKDSIDVAFNRRLTFKLKFPFPDATTRQRIWERLVPLERLDPDVDLADIAEAFELSGGSVRTVVLRAAYRAAIAGTAITTDILATLAVDECRALGRLVRDDLLRKK